MGSPDQAAKDAALIQRIIKGDTERYADIIARYQQPLLRYAIYLIHDPDMAADVVQISFIKAYRNLRAYNPRYKFSSWLYRIVHNEAMNAVRKAKHTVSESDEPEYIEHFVSENLVEQRIDQDFLRDDMQACLAGLDVKYRDVLWLYYFQGMKYADISTVLHIPAATVGVRIQRAKAALKKICQQKGVTYE